VVDVGASEPDIIERCKKLSRHIIDSAMAHGTVRVIVDLLIFTLFLNARAAGCWRRRPRRSSDGAREVRLVNEAEAVWAGRRRIDRSWHGTVAVRERGAVGGLHSRRVAENVRREEI
jgi:hypothetical protein